MPNSEKFLKVNIRLEGGSATNGEGVWAEAYSQEDFDLYTDESRKGETFKVKVLNHPVTTAYVKHSDVIEAVNMGSNRPVTSIKYKPSF